MSSRDVREVTCDFCERTALTESDQEVPGWYQLFRDDCYKDFCSSECICKEFQPAADCLYTVEDAIDEWAF